MTLWLVFALMTAGAIFAVLWPLGRAGVSRRDGSETAIYRDQLAEIARDRDAALIGAPEAEAARVEVSRRLIAAADSELAATPSRHPGLRRAVAIVALIALPLGSGLLYLRQGSPRLPDFPLASREVAPAAGASLETLVAQVEGHLDKNPGDGRGWEVLAPVYGKLGRFDDAVRAYRNALRLNGESAARHADLGEAMAAAASGVVTQDSKSEFERAVALDAREVKARFFLGLAAQQDGRAQDAATIWRGLLQEAPADAPWRPLVQQSLSSLGSVPALSDDDMARAKDMSADQRNVMVRAMVERLASRLKQNSDDAEGWLRLVRAYMVLGERDKAKAALSDARQALQANPDGLRQINDGLRDLGLDG